MNIASFPGAPKKTAVANLLNVEPTGRPELRPDDPTERSWTVSGHPQRLCDRQAETWIKEHPKSRTTHGTNGGCEHFIKSHLLYTVQPKLLLMHHCLKATKSHHPLTAETTRATKTDRIVSTDLFQKRCLGDTTNMSKSI